MNKTIGFVMFVLGAAVGSAVTWQYTKKKYEQIAQEEIDSVREIFSRRESAAGVEITVSEPQTAKIGKPEEKPDITEYAARLEREGYTNYSKASAEQKKEEQEAMEMKPYIISPEEFGEFEDYERISLSYYADQVLADEDNEKVEDVDNVIGLESLTHFGEFEDDSVFIRNDRLRCDYEILLDQRTYSDVIKQRPHQMEV